MRIAVYYNLNFGGAKRAVYEQVKGLVGLGHEIDVYTTDNASDIFDFSKTSHRLFTYKFTLIENKIPFISRLLNDIKTFYTLSKLHKKIARDIDKRRYDFVVVHPDKYTQAPFILKYLKTKNAYYCQEPLRIVYEYNLKADKKIGLIKYLYEIITRKIRKRIDVENVRSARFTLASCYHIRERMIEVYGVYPRISYLGVNEKVFKPSNLPIKNQVFFVGNKDVVNDGYDLAIDAVNMITKKYRPELKIVEWTNEENKRISDFELAREYEESIAVLCTNKLETFGLVPIETMASGGIVIATNISGHRETVINGLSGFLVDLDPYKISEVLLNIIKNPNVAKKIRKSSREYIEINWALNKRTLEFEKQLLELIKYDKKIKIPIISIILVNYNVKKELFECINSIIKNEEKLNYEIIVVDNSEKNKIEVDLKKIDSKIQYIKPEFNLGYGKGNNLGVSYAKGEYIFILNPDTKIVYGTIYSLVKFIQKNKKIGAVAPQILDSNNKVYDEQGAKELTPKSAILVLSFINKFFKKNRYWKEYWGIPWNKKKVKQVDIVPGTAFIIKESVFEKIGGFDEKFFLFFEEFDLCKRLIDSGYKNYILPDLKISHIWGASTKKNSFTEKYFKQSRFYYFKKNFGLVKALIVESFLRINKNFISLILILLLALILRIYKLESIMPFIGDTAWYFVLARDILINDSLPLVGITSSHVWLHQGAYWGYVLAAVFKAFGFNPINAAYFSVILDLGALICLYYFCRTFFSTKIAIISSLLYAVSPFIVITAQIPYHTSPIPFLTILLLLSIFRWIDGNARYFPISIFLLAVLYNFQISILPLIFSFLIILTFGIYKKTEWFKKIWNRKTLFYSTLAFLIPMMPMLIFDLTHEFSQTLKVAVWIGYKFAVFFGYPPINPNTQGDPLDLFLDFVLLHLGRIYFIKSNLIGFLVFLSSFIYLLLSIYKNKFKNKYLNILFLFLSISLISFLGMKSRSQAYLPIFFPMLIISLSYLFSNIKSRYNLIVYFVIGIIVITNVNSVLNFPRHSEMISLRLDAAKKIINEANGRPYNLVGKGPTSEFASFTAPYEYLTWWLGTPPSNKNEKLKFYITDSSDKIIIEKKYLK